MLNVNILKDELNNLLDRDSGDEGAQFVWPDWLPDEWYGEMCSERRTAKGWEKPSGARNEAWDLSTYLLGICRHRKVDRINWESPPDWAASGRKNPHFTPASTDPTELVVAQPTGRYKSLAELAEKLA